MIEHIQLTTEQQKATLARELHDELGGLLVGAVMDLAWAEQHLSAPRPELQQKLLRARQTLSAAIDLKRRLIENLRPTLLDNVGLFAALRWHVESICKAKGVFCRIRVPAEERRFQPNIPIALFRIVEEIYGVLIVRERATSTDLTVTIDELAFTIDVVMRDGHRQGFEGAVEAHSLAAIEYRVSALGGRFEQSRHEDDMTLRAVFALADVLASNPV